MCFLSAMHAHAMPICPSLSPLPSYHDSLESAWRRVHIVPASTQSDTKECRTVQRLKLAVRAVYVLHDAIVDIEKNRVCVIYKRHKLA